jgi:hypothetical protein
MEKNQDYNFERTRVEIEYAKLKNEEKKLALDAERLAVERERILVDVNKPLVDGMFKFAELTVRSLLILNGGAAIGLLTFAGKAFETKPIPQPLACALFAFGLGAVSSVILAGTSYLAQHFYNKGLTGADWERTGLSFHGVAVVAAFFGLGAFGYGILKASEAFS